LNDGDFVRQIALISTDSEPPNAYEGAGLIFSAAQSITAFKFSNGSYDAGQDGVFDADLRVQSTADGVTWRDIAGWTVSPAYPYNSAAAANKTYTFSGPAITARGIRCVGQIRTSEVQNSWFVRATEVQALTAAASTPMPIPAPDASLIGDTQPPTVTMLNPSNGAKLLSSVTIKTTASDNVAVSKLVISVNGMVKKTCLASTPTSPLSCSYKWANIRRGSYTITATASDPAGNTGSSSVAVTR